MKIDEFFILTSFGGQTNTQMVYKIMDKVYSRVHSFIIKVIFIVKYFSEIGDAECFRFMYQNEGDNLIR